MGHGEDHRIEEKAESLLAWLQIVYANDLCNGSWEHVHGFTITNIDNPGWDFSFDLRDTDFEDFPFDEVFIQNSESDWYQCWIKDATFRGWGGAKNLIDILAVFKRWYLSASAIADGNENMAR